MKSLTLKERRDKIFSWIAEGKTYADVGDALDISRQRIEQILSPFKQNARAKILEAVRKGQIKKEACESCGSPVTEAHHDDYLKPLEVNWLCRKHHMERHKGRNVGRRPYWKIPNTTP